MTTTTQTTTHRTGTRDEWLAARLDLLQAEKEVTRVAATSSRDRRGYGSIRPTDSTPSRGTRSLADLFRGRSQLLVYHFMFGPDYTGGLSGLLGDRRRVQRRGDPPRQPRRDALGGLAGAAGEAAGLRAADRVELSLGLRDRQRLQCRFQRLLHGEAAASGRGSTTTSGRGGAPSATGKPIQDAASADTKGPDLGAALTGTDVDTYTRERPGMSAFALEDGVVYHTYSAYARGLDGSWGAYQWLDRAPRGRNETDFWIRRRDEYPKG